jgi:hypothetical protein
MSELYTSIGKHTSNIKASLFDLSQTFKGYIVPITGLKICKQRSLLGSHWNNYACNDGRTDKLCFLFGPSDAILLCPYRLGIFTA